MSKTFITISLIALILGIVFLIAAAVIFVKLKIWIVWADLSGKTARASIEMMRAQDSKAAPRKRHHSYVVNSSMLKGKKTENLEADRTEPIGKRFGRKTEPLKNSDETLPLKKPKNVMSDNDATLPLNDGTLPLDNTDGTIPLGENNETTLLDNLDNEEGTVLLNNEEGTVVLNSGATTVIGQTGKLPVKFNVITDIVMIHTSEKITLE